MMTEYEKAKVRDLINGMTEEEVDVAAEAIYSRAKRELKEAAADEKE